MTSLLAIIWIALGVYSLGCIFFPPMRGNWAGTRIACGPIGSLGFGLIFGSWGVRTLFRDSLPFHFRYLLIWLSMQDG